jgi:sulfur-oxidizing protein SoxX
MTRAGISKTNNFNVSGLGVFCVGVVGATFMLAGVGLAGDVAPGDIKFIEDNSQVAASITGKAGDATAGRKAFANRKQGNCLACHENSEMSEQSFHGEIGPSLDGVAGRYQQAELRAIMIDSKIALDEGTMMPGFYSLSLGSRIAGKFKDKTILNAQQVEDVIAYLQTLK